VKLGQVARRIARAFKTTAEQARWHRTLTEHCFLRPDPYALEFHAAHCSKIHPDDATARWRHAVGLLARSRVREAMAVAPDILPARPPEARPEQLDLTLFYNQRLEGSGSSSFDWDGFRP
jgi:hypothetical protein